jgi:predicted O-linked N-acetylglucosamine transferase (SPINDLY family)
MPGSSPQPPHSPSELARAQHNHGLHCAQQGQIDHAVDAFRSAIALKPDLLAAHANLGVLLAQRGDAIGARSALEKALSLKPDHVPTLVNLANLLNDLGELDAAQAHALKALQLSPDSAAAHLALANALRDAGRIAEALEVHRRAAVLHPQVPHVVSGYLYALHFDPAQTRASLAAEHRRWAPLAWPPREGLDLASAPRLPTADRKLRVGYISADFREHPVGRFILPLLQHHDRSQFDIFCYANLAVEDDFTAVIRLAADEWRSIAALSDETAAALVRSDGIDILVDLSMHLRGNRLGVFAARPAPIQATYLAYCSTTGLAQIDYRLTDAWLDPPDADAHYTEQSLRLAGGYWCYADPPVAASVSGLPAQTAGHITFGALNHFRKVNAPTIELWQRVLAATPGSRLMVHAGQGSQRRALCAALQVEEDRINFVNRLPLDAYFQAYQHIDIALDTVGCCGGTTSCDALWMGVPVVSLTGATAVARSGLSILSTIGHAEWAVADAARYVQVVCELASDLNRLAEIRARLRDEMRASPLMDAARFATDVEDAYRLMCRGGRPG